MCPACRSPQSLAWSGSQDLLQALPGPGGLLRDAAKQSSVSTVASFTLVGSREPQEHRLLS